MPKQLQVRLILAGPYTGRTGNVGGYYFDRGVCIVTGAPEMLTFMFTRMARAYQAYPEGSLELEKAQAFWQAHLDAEAAKEEREEHGANDLSTGNQPEDGTSNAETESGPDGAGAPPVSDVHGGANDDALPNGDRQLPGGDGLPDAGANADGAAPGDDDTPVMDAPPLVGLDGQPLAGDQEAKLSKLAMAIMSLDPANDEHWTGQGIPAMSAVEKAYGSTDITRNNVENELPGWTREKAREAVTE